MSRGDWWHYFLTLFFVAMCGVAIYFALWLCGMPAEPKGYGGAALLAVLLWKLVWMVGRDVKES